MKFSRTATLIVSLIVSTASLAQRWHHPLYLGNGEFWQRRIRVRVQNRASRPAAGEPVRLAVGTGPNEANLTGARINDIRVCDSEGTEMLYALLDTEKRPVRKGPVPRNATLVIPVECAPNESSDYFIYWDNPSAWAVPDILEAFGELRNGGLEQGTGTEPFGWQHDTNDDEHRTFWVAENPRSGKKCLKTEVAAGARHTWIATRQRNIRIIGAARYTMTAWVKASDLKGNAGWYIHVGNRKNTMMISPMLHGGDGTYGWKKVSAEFAAPEEADLANLGTVLRGTGTAWFDDVSLTCDEQSRLDAEIFKPEELPIGRTGTDAPWTERFAGSDTPWDSRASVRRINLTNTAADNLVSVDLGPITARMKTAAGNCRFRLVDNGRDIPFHLLQDICLFEMPTPANTAHTAYLYVTIPDKSPNTKSSSRTQGEFAPNPAIPGAAEAERGRRTIQKSDYGQLLQSPLNLVKNASFEQGDHLPEAWSGGGEGGTPDGTSMQIVEGGLFGKKCVRMDIPAEADKTWTGWHQDVAVKPGRTYMFAAWVKTEQVVPGVQLHAHFRNAAGELCEETQYASAGPPISGTQDWTMLSGMFNMPNDVTTFQLHLTMLAGGTVRHDGVIVAEVSPGEVGRLQRRRRKALDTLTAWAVPSIVKVFHDDPVPSTIPSAEIACASNEWESLQVAVRGPNALEDLTIELDPPASADGNTLIDSEISVPGYVPIDHKTSYYRTNSPDWHRRIPGKPGACDGWPGMWPDPLLPTRTFDLEPMQTQPVWITFRVPKGAPSGNYHGTVRLTQKSKTLLKLPFTVQVWDFELPETSHLKAIYDCRQGRRWHRPGQTAEEGLRAMWKFMAERRLCPDRIRITPDIRFENGKVIADFTDFDRAAEYYFEELNLPHSYTPGDFYLFGWGHLPGTKFGESPYPGEYPFEGAARSRLRPEYKRAYQACLRAFWDHVKTRGWADRIVLYISDEPHDKIPGVVTQMKALCDMIHEVDPEIRIYSSTWHHQPEWDRSLDVWGIGHYGIVPEKKIEELQSSGATIWWTTDGQMCTDTPYCAIERLLPHYCFSYGAKAYEFWGVDWLTYDPYEYGWHAFLVHNFGPDTPDSFVRYPNGDGFLAYPGAPIGHPGPVASIRLEQAREGVEDYEYLHLLRQIIEKRQAEGADVTAGEAALEHARILTPMPCDNGRYSTRALPDPELLYRIREKLALAIENLNQ